MANSTAEIVWDLKDGDDFASGRYGRAHTIGFDGGAIIAASASPHVVGKWAEADAVDPEEMLVAALSSCHMLTFLHVARLAGLGVTAYRDHAEGRMTESGTGRQAITKVMLNPKIEWSRPAPDAHRLSQLHEAAHAGCIIANSVRTEVIVIS